MYPKDEQAGPVTEVASCPLNIGPAALPKVPHTLLFD